MVAALASQSFRHRYLALTAFFGQPALDHPFTSTAQWVNLGSKEILLTADNRQLTDTGTDTGNSWFQGDPSDN